MPLVLLIWLVQIRGVMYGRYQSGCEVYHEQSGSLTILVDGLQFDDDCIVKPFALHVYFRRGKAREVRH